MDVELDFSPEVGEITEGLETYDGFGLTDPYEDE
jgi:hypothetical protein